MIDNSLFLGAIGASSGVASILWNAINSRRAALLSMRPKVNVDLTYIREGDFVKTHMEIRNVGTHEMKLKSFRLYIYDMGFNDDFLMGLANYNDNLFLHDNRILNKMNGIDIELNYENFVEVIRKLLNYTAEKVTSIISVAIFEEITKYNRSIEEFRDKCRPFTPVLLIRPFFLFQENIKYYTDLKKMPEETFPQAVTIILFDKVAYDGRAMKDVFALNSFTYRINWEKNPAWAINNNRELNEFEEKYGLNKIHPMFAQRENQALLSVAPSELGIPEKLAPGEKRSINFQIQVKNQADIGVKVNLWISNNQTKYYILKKEITSNYHFSSTPLEWVQPIRI